MIKTVGSLCSGIETGTVAWKGLGFKYCWYSEIADFPNQILKTKYPETVNLGDMVDIPELLINKKIESPDFICGGTPCQAFSFAGFKSGLEDDRGNLTLKFVDVIEANDTIRHQKGKNRTVVFWENVEGVLSDKTNAFGCLISCLAGLNEPIVKNKWPKAGAIKGPKRNVAWRVIDAKYFGIPQQRKRLYVLAGGKDFNPENVLFEEHNKDLIEYPEQKLIFEKDGHKYQVFRSYTDCVYAAYGTKWNGNAAANNGSLFVVQDERIRRMSPLECERLMGFEDYYTKLPNAKRTQRYTAIGNAWAVPVIKWIGERLNNGFEEPSILVSGPQLTFDFEVKDYTFYEIGDTLYTTQGGNILNCTVQPEESKFGDIKEIISDQDISDKLYITPVACYGILRRGKNINPELKKVLERISSEMTKEEIEKRSRRQPRGEKSGMAKLAKEIKKRKLKDTLN